MKFEHARLKYKPKVIKYLFIAEAPPKSNSERFFYFENVNEKDSLFWETMKVLYPKLLSNKKIKELRPTKSVFLKKFQNDGFYLIDSLTNPFEDKSTSSKKIKLIVQGQKELLNKINSLINSETKIILISSTVFEANYMFLKNNNIFILNNEFINFPSTGWQKIYKEKLNKTLNF